MHIFSNQLLIMDYNSNTLYRIKMGVLIMGSIININNQLNYNKIHEILSLFDYSSYVNINIIYIKLILTEGN